MAETTTTTTTTTPDDADIAATEIEALIRGANDLGHAAALLREYRPELDQAARLAEIKRVTAKIFAERDKPNARRESIARMARQHQGERHREDE